MKVLLLHQHFHTPDKGGALRSYYLAKALASEGIETIVITGHNGASYRKEDVEGIEVHYLPIPYDNSFGFYERSQSFINYTWASVRLARKFKDADVCYAISVPLTVGVAALLIWWWYKIPYIFEVGDLWPDAPVQMGFIKNGFFKKALYRLEKVIYTKAESIVALSPSIQVVIEKKIRGKEIHLIPNMGDTNFFRLQPKDAVLEHKFNVRNKFVVSYIGAIGLANGLTHFLACAKASENARLPVHFLLCGEGAMLTSLQGKIGEWSLQNFTVIPFQNREGVREILNVTDATFISYQPIPILETGSPNKYFDGLAAGKLIIVNFGGWIKEEIEMNRCGIYVNQKIEDDFVNGISPFLLSEKLLRQYQQASRSLAENNYSRELLSEKFVTIFKGIDKS